MATSYTSLLGFALPVQGELSGTWGDVVNDSITQLVEDSVAGVATADVTSGNWTLTTTGSGAQNQARCAILIPTGTPGVSRNVIAPGSSKAYIVLNQSDAAVVIKASASTGVTVAAGDQALVAWNGSDFEQITSTGDVVGPGSSTDNAVPTFDGTTGKLLQNNSGVTISSGVITASGGFAGDLNGSVGATTPNGVAATQVDVVEQGELRLQDTTGGQYVGFKAPGTVSASYTLTVPSADGNSGEVLTTDGSGNLSWTVPTADEVVTTNFSIVESGGVLLIKYGATAIVQIDSSGNITSIANVTAYGSI